MCAARRQQLLSGREQVVVSGLEFNRQQYNLMTLSGEDIVCCNY